MRSVFWGSPRIQVKRRRDIADLVYLWRIRNLGAHRLERKLIDWLREEDEGVDNGVTIRKGTGSAKNWMDHITTLLKEFKLKPESYASQRAWKKAVYAKAWKLERQHLIEEEYTRKSPTMSKPYSYMELRNSALFAMPRYQYGWAKKRRRKGKVLTTALRLRSLQVGTSRVRQESSSAKTRLVCPTNLNQNYYH